MGMVAACPCCSERGNLKDIDVTVTVDSGAYNTVGPPHVATHFKLTDTVASKNGHQYKAANGTVIINYGKRDRERISS